MRHTCTTENPKLDYTVDKPLRHNGRPGRHSLKCTCCKKRFSFMHWPDRKHDRAMHTAIAVEVLLEDAREGARLDAIDVEIAREARLHGVLLECPTVRPTKVQPCDVKKEAEELVSDFWFGASNAAVRSAVERLQPQ